MEGPGCEEPHLALGGDSGKWDTALTAVCPPRPDESTTALLSLPQPLPLHHCSRLGGMEELCSQVRQRRVGQPVTGSKASCRCLT